MKKVLLFLALAVLSLSGCGFAITAGPPSGWQSADEARLQAMAESNQASPCTREGENIRFLDTSVSRLAINADQIVGSVLAANAIGIMAGAGFASSVGEGVGTAIITNVVTAAVFMLSAHRGERKILDCEEFHLKLDESLAPVR
jgi:hypothetical protein